MSGTNLDILQICRQRSQPWIAGLEQQALRGLEQQALPASSSKHCREGQNGGMTDPSPPPGTGPGVITPDGCAVDFYARMTALGEPEIVHEAAGPGASVLELGCGTGRITHPLVALGHPVVAVDESPEMLAQVRDAETVCARIE